MDSTGTLVFLGSAVTEHRDPNTLNGTPRQPEVLLVFDVCRWLVELIDGSPLLIATWRQMIWFEQSFRLFRLEVDFCGTQNKW